jgi:Zn-dependent peptidase ImmA (M78 family)
MPVKEARGFSLNGGALPAVVVNSSDAVQAKIFTLFHELAHLGLKTPGVCLPRLDETMGESENVEAFCNRFSGALLAPLDALRGALPARGSDDDTVEETARRLASQFKVSRYVMLFRFLRADAVSKAQFQRIFDKWERAKVETPQRSKGGPPPHVKALSRLGPRFVSNVLDAYARGLLTTSDVADYLSLKTRHLPQLQRMLATERRG